MGLSSFKTSFEYIANPLGLAVRVLLHRQLHRDVLPVRHACASSSIPSTYIALAAAITLAVSVPASFTFAKGRFPAREGLRTAMIATLIMPPVTFLVPSYVMMANLGLIDTSAAGGAPLGGDERAGERLPPQLADAVDPQRGARGGAHRRRGLSGDAAADGPAAQSARDRHGDDLQHHGLVERSADPVGLHRARREDDGYRRGGDDSAPGSAWITRSCSPGSSWPRCHRSWPTSSCSATSGAVWSLGAVK